MGVGLKPGLPDGTYTATYRVISADTHIVYGGLVFSIGHAGPAPKVTVAGLIGRNESGEVTEVAFGAVRGLDYVSLALFIGGLAFLLVAWLAGLAAAARTSRAANGGRRRARSPGACAGCCSRPSCSGSLVSVLGILLQGASAAGVSLWSSLKGGSSKTRCDSRFGEVWGARAIDWLALGSPAASRAGCRRERRAPAALGARRLLGDRLAPIWRSRPRWPATRASRAPRRCSFRRTSCTCSGRACGSAGSRACCWRCPRRPGAASPPSAAGCCWRCSRGSRRWRSRR